MEGTSTWRNMQGETLIVFFVLMPLSSFVTSLSVYQSKHGHLTSLLLFESDKLIVGGRNAIYQFSPGNISKSNLEFELDTRCMNQACDTDNVTINDVSILSQFSIDSRGHYILFCGTENAQRCYAIKNDITTQSFEMKRSTLGSRTSAYVVKTQNNNLLFSAVDGAPETKNDATLSLKHIRYYKSAFQIYIYSSTTIKAKEMQTLDFVYGFEDQNFTYILHNNLTAVTTQTFISQTCTNRTYFKSYVEARISCGDYDILASAYFHRSPDTGAFVLGVFSSSKQPGSALCAFSVSKLQEWFSRAKEKCFWEASGSWPFWIKPSDAATDGHSCTTRNYTAEIYCERRFNTRIRASVDLQETPILTNVTRIMTSVIMTSHNDTFIVYVGDRKGYVTKMLFDSNFDQSMTLYSVDTGAGDPIRKDMLLDEARNHLYFTYGDKVAMLERDNCSLHASCVGCLSDRASCQWVAEGSSEPRGMCVQWDAEDYDVGSDNRSVFTDHCLPVIELVRPLSGPTQGGTLVTISGQFNGLSSDRDRIHVSLGENVPCNITSVSGERIECTTGPVSMDTLEATVNLTVNEPETIGGHKGQLSVEIYGSFSYENSFVYKTPSANLSGPETFVRQSGGVQIRIFGANLDVGAGRSVKIGNKICPISTNDKVIDSAITCRAPEMSSTGRYPTELFIDGAILPGPDITYIEDPTINSVRPDTVIVSGGVKITFGGTNLLGLGTSRMILEFLDNDGTVLNNQTPGECFVVDEQLECRSGAVVFPYASYVIPVEFSAQIENVYRDAVLFLTNPVMLGNTALSIVNDPEFSDLQQIFYMTSDTEELTLEGEHLLNVVKDEILIHVGPEKCVVLAVADEVLTCSFDVTEPMMTGNSLLVKAVVGYRTYELGHATYQHETDVTGNTVIAEANSGFLSFVYGIVAFVGIIVLVVSGLIVYRKRKMRGLSLNEPYSATYRNGDFIMLDGLSESHLGENDQNQRNVYQEQTFAKSTDDNPETEPLLLDDNTRLLLERQDLLIDRNCLVMAEVIGQGNFGCVYKCFYTVPGEKEEKLVAAKTLHRPDPRDLDVQMFVKEALIMKDFHHRNVMELTGICFGLDRLPLVVLPYMRTGDLLSYLRDAKNSPRVSDLVVFGIDIANGMHYLSQLKFVHRDLAARNCMLTDDLTVKIADFGLSRDVYEKEYYSSHDKNAKLPIKWMSPESLEYRVFSSKSDVWSYAVVLWELLTRGMIPYPTVDNWEILRYLKEGRRMVKPDHCPSKVYKIMQRCWAWEPDDRPTFGDLTIEMPEILQNPK